ncbi:MAG: 3,4-dihydroxy 2-butanone 4-phosphate synthase / cyclohydrolase [Mycobacteriales bacterium]|jgi:3,4-dihydroxy 2-butanone 4-phosphate synthase/GTP cyclohydrolase II
MQLANDNDRGHPATPRRGAGADRITRALIELAAGGLVVVADDPGRENEIDFIAAASGVSAATVALMVRHGSGLICAALPGGWARRLRLPPQVTENEDAKGTAYTVLCDAVWPVDGRTHTGISAADRAHTLRTLADESTPASGLTRPGHIAPLIARPGGVLERGGHTEAGVDLCRLAGLPPVAAIVEITHDDGRMVRLHEWDAFRTRHDLSNYPVLTIAELAAYRRRTERLVVHVAQSELPTAHGRFTVHAYRHAISGVEHLALVLGEPGDGALVRVHSECRTGDALGSLRCDCRAQLELALATIAADGRGVLVYLGGHEGRGIGLANKIAAYGLQDEGADTYEANRLLGLPLDARDYHSAAHILADLGVRRVRLLTNNTAKRDDLADHQITVLARVPLETRPTPQNQAYLTAKAHAGHLLTVAPAAAPARTA